MSRTILWAGKSPKMWLVATRPWSFPASAMPVLVTISFLYWQGYSLDVVSSVWALLNVVVFHAAGNTWSDYHDYSSGVDAVDTYGVRTLTDGLFTPKEIRNLSVGLLVVALLGGLGLLWRTGWPLLWIGLGGLLCTVCYPPLKYHALGDVVILAAYAWLPTWGTSYVAVGSIDWRVLLLALPVGMITVAIWHANNMRDVLTDKRAGIHTLPQFLGSHVSAGLQTFWLLMPFLCVAICVGLKWFPLWSLLVGLALPMAWSNVKQMWKAMQQNGKPFVSQDEQTAKLQLLFSLLLSISFVIAACIS